MKDKAEQDFPTPYELAVSTGFIGVLELDENTATESQARVRAKLVTSAQRRSMPSEWLAQCAPTAPPPSDMALWDAVRSVGRKVW
jgi:hypothetical protein